MLSRLKGLVRPVVYKLRRKKARRRLMRALQTTSPPYRLVVGAGPAPIDGWINTDIAPRVDALYLDATEPWPLPAESVSHIYSDNMIEHVPFGGAQRLLANAYRALVPEGSIRIATPDAEATARMYLDDPENCRKHLDTYIALGYKDINNPVDVLRGTFTFHGHHAGYIWDFPSLAKELERAGFRDITKETVGESSDPLFRDLEQRTEPTERMTTLVVEARK